MALWRVEAVLFPLREVLPKLILSPKLLLKGKTKAKDTTKTLVEPLVSKIIPQEFFFAADYDEWDKKIS